MKKEATLIKENGIHNDDWVMKKLGDIAEFKNGLNYKSDDIGKSTLIVGVSDFKDNFLIDQSHLSSVKVQSISDDYLMKNGDIVFVRSNGNKQLIGRVLFAKDITQRITHSGFTIRARIKSELVRSEYCAIYCSSALIKKQFMIKGGGSNINNLNQQILSDIDIQLPLIHEQDGIIEILNVWDKANELKEKLIEQKKEQKKGLMQKLLTGEVRLPGFDVGWKEVKLGDVLKERREIGYDDLELLAITSNKGVVKRTEVDIKDNSSSDKSRYKRILPNDIGYNTMRMWQGVSGISIYEGIVSPAYTILKPTNKVDALFMSYLFKIPKVINLFRRYSQGLVSDTLNLKYNNFKGIKVGLPTDVNEQKQIAKILYTQDTEIEALEKERDTQLEQKKGLMQLLLTGKIRVKV